MADRRVSQGKTRNFRSIHPSHLRPRNPDDFGLSVCLPLRPSVAASYALRVPRAGTLPRASFPPRLAATQLPLRLGVPVIRVPRGLSPPSHAPCLAHTNQAARRTGRQAVFEERRVRDKENGGGGGNRTHVRMPRTWSLYASSPSIGSRSPRLRRAGSPMAQPGLVLAGIAPGRLASQPVL